MQETQIDVASATESRAMFTADAAALFAAVDYLNRRVVERRNSVPMLSTVRIVADLAGFVAITGTDLDLEATMTVAADVERPGAFCTPADALADVLAKLKRTKGAQITIEHGEAPGISHGRHNVTPGTVIATSGRNRFQLGSLPHDEFPALTFGGGNPIAFALPAGQFMADVRALEPCQSKDHAREYLNGIALQVRELGGRDRLAMVATDGGSIAIASRPIPAGAADLPDLILPRKAVGLLVAAAKVAGEVEALSAEYAADRVRFAVGAVTLTTKLVEGDFPGWQHVFTGQLAPTGAQGCLFPDLLPGARVAALEKLAKVSPGPIAWEPTQDGLLGTVDGDDGLLFGACNLADASECGRKGFFYGIHGDGEIVGPDGIAYPVAMSESAIHLSKEQVRALVGESCFEAMAIEIAGRTVYILRWCYEDGANRFLTVRSDGRCFDHRKEPRVYLTRAEVDAALAGEVMPAAAAEPAEKPQDAPEAVEPTEGPATPFVIAGEALAAATDDPTPLVDKPADHSGSVAEAAAQPNPTSEPDCQPGPAADVLARLDALERQVAALEERALISAAANAGEEIKHQHAPTSLAPTDGADIIRLPVGDRRATAFARTRRELDLARPKRTAAHERAIRRAWAERSARRTAEERSAMLARSLDQVRERVDLEESLALKAEMRAERAESVSRTEHAKRKATVERARARIAKVARLADDAGRRAAAAESGLADLRRNLADPSQPERASDVARLVRERDQARTACAALEARSKAQAAALDRSATAIEELAGRVARAEAALRRAA